MIPALNEAVNMPPVMASIPKAHLLNEGWETEIIVVDNGSTDGTGHIARTLGARVVVAERRGYGNAYMAGFAAATGAFIATGDADGTYPFEELPELLRLVLDEDIDFLTTNRLVASNGGAMTFSHCIGNRCLSAASRALFRNGIRDSQSGMWVFRRSILANLPLTSPGMAFSQEIKNAATSAGLRCLEVPIRYRLRSGEVKLNAVRDGVRNLWQLIRHRTKVAMSGRSRGPVSEARDDRVARP